MIELPPLPFDGWRDTLATLHRVAQIVGKVALAVAPPVNHFWDVALLPTATGLTTHLLPYRGGGFQMSIELATHDLTVRTTSGESHAIPLIPRPVADTYREVMAVLDALGIRVGIWDTPVEIPTEVVPFHLDRLHAAYERAPVERFRRALAWSALVLEEMRARFVGKQSPVHLFWGSFDLAYSRFSGRRAPPRPDADRVTAESYSHEVWSTGFWPGDARFPMPAYYAYLAPMLAGYDQAAVRPAAAFWHPEIKEFLLPYDAVRQAEDPRATLLAFAQSTYEAGAELAGWKRDALERGGIVSESVEHPAW
jgi:hypothetical protein